MTSEPTLQTRLHDDNCNAVAELLIQRINDSCDQNKSPFDELLRETAESPEAALPHLNRVLSDDQQAYQTILTSNIKLTQYDLLQLIRDICLPFKEPVLAQFSPRTFIAGPMPSKNAVIMPEPKPEPPIPRQSDREPLLSDIKYAQPWLVVVITFVIFLMIGVLDSLLRKYVSLSLHSGIALIAGFAFIASIFLSQQIDNKLRRFNFMARHRWKKDLEQWHKGNADFATEMAEYRKRLEAWKASWLTASENQRSEWGKRVQQQKTATEKWNSHEEIRIAAINAERMHEYHAKKESFTIIRDSCQYLETGLRDCQADAISDFMRLGLLFLRFPCSFPRAEVVQYLPDRKALAVSFRLPAEEDIVFIKELRFIKKTGELQQVLLKQKERDALYTSILAQVALSVISQMFASDNTKLVDIIFFQGWLKYMDRSVGKEVEPTVMTLQVSREVAASIDFSQIDPVECFNKRLKGICATKTKNIVPVQPLIVFDKNDTRFVPGYDVISSVSTETNLATMDWQAFENLVRDLFEKKYAGVDQEVKITRSSRDKGVDAILFDPDPIKGGKIIIQAKRYVNTVAVSAVRDLYGTVMSEGANRGILVTTAHYGSDSYEFAKNKPLTLLSGSELLALLLDIGVSAHIDLDEARRINDKSVDT